MNDDQWHINLGIRLRRWRVDADLTQRQAAEQIGVHVNTLAGYETAKPGHYQPAPRAVPALFVVKAAAVYRVPVEKLLGI